MTSQLNRTTAPVRSLMLRTTFRHPSARSGSFLAPLARLAALAAFPLLLTSCGGGGSSAPPPPPPPTYTANSGLAQKGPLIKGSAVTAQELDAKLSPTGKQYSYQITSDLGTFLPTSTFGSQYIGLNATGYYFDEVANAISTGTVTLVGYSDLTASSVLNVNLLTTLAYERIQHLIVSSNMTFAAAKTQAESEVLAALNIPANNYGGFGTLDLAGSTDGDHILAAISSLFVYGNSAGPLSQLIANFQSDIGTNGVITSAATKITLTNAGIALNPAAIAANLTQEYSSVGVTFTATNISDWIDQNGDGVVGKFKFQVADATPSSVFTLPSFVVDQVAGTSVSVTGGTLSVNQTPVSGAVTVHTGDVVALSPGAGTFPMGVLNIYLLSGTTKTARVSFVSGLLSIAVTPAAPNLPKGLTQQFKATGTFSDTSTADLTNSVSWTSGTPAIATVNAASGLATSLVVGSTVVTATSGSVSGSTTLTVTPAIVESISITPNPAFAGIGISRQLAALGTYSDATTADVTAIATWSSDTPSVATVGPTTGLAMGVALGSATISAAIGSVTATASLSIVTGVWSPTGSLSALRAYHTATLLPNGRVLVAGGQSGSGITATAELYDPIAGTWSPTGSLSTARAYHRATLLPNGNVLVTGGYNNAYAPISASELYDPVAGTWASTGSLATARVYHTATLLANGKVLVAGGGELNAGGVVATSELYDPATGTWVATGSLSTARFHHSATLLQSGKVLVAGGENQPPVPSSELYDPATGAWSPTGSLTTPRGDHTATLLPNGTVLVAGGFSYGNTQVTATSELYDPVAGTWTSTGSLATARAYHTATLLPNGKVLAAGGAKVVEGIGGSCCTFGPVSYASAELFDPGAGAWSPTGSLATARDSHTATLLANGVILVAGGDSGNTSFSALLASAELYW